MYRMQIIADRQQMWIKGQKKIKYRLVFIVDLKSSDGK